jgi:DNA-directed RNA polymerase specialized sigma subunit
MSRMSELDIEIRERTVARQTPAEIAKALGIPQHWVVEMIEENAYNDYMDKNASRHYYADDSADADAQAYGTR